MWPDIIDNFLTTSVTATVIFVFGYLLAYGVGYLVLRHDRASMEGRLDRLVTLNKGCSLRMDQRRRELTTVEQAHALKKRELFLLKRRLSEIIAGEGKLIRSIGEDECRNARQPARKFVANITNEPMIRADPEARTLRAVAPDWAQPQEVIVWATEQALARQLAERIYPVSLGFVIHSVRPADGPAEAGPKLLESA